MRIIARVDGNHQAFILGGIKCTHLNQVEQISFLVDTGCSVTCLLSDDVTRLRINWQPLSYAPHSVRTANGTTIPRLLPDVDVYLPALDGFMRSTHKILHVHYPQMQILPPNPQLPNPQPTCYTCSLLGMDFLHRFRKWVFRDGFLTMDT